MSTDGAMTEKMRDMGSSVSMHIKMSKMTQVECETLLNEVVKWALKLRTMI